jgi:putative MATE family efflux protein
MPDLTTGSIANHLLKTTSFMLVSMVFQTLYVLVDLYWVGRLGTSAVAAVGISGNLMFVVLAASQMLGVGTTTLVSHAAGRKDRDRALVVFNQSQVLSFVVAVVFLAVGWTLREPYARQLSADEETTALAVQYLNWMIPAMALQFTMVAMGSAMRGIGDFKPGMVVQTATVVINMILAPFLIFGWGTGYAMGVAGAAVASLIAIAVGVVWLFTYFVGEKAFLQFVPADWTPKFRLWGDMLKIGLPAGAEFAMMAVYLAMVYSIIRPFGAPAQAGFGIGLRIVQSLFLPVVALGFAVGPVAGQNFGARRGDRVRETFKVAATMSAGVMLVFVGLAHIAPAAMVRLFSADPNVVAVGDEYLRIVSYNFVASGIVFVSSSMFQAMGNTIPSLATSVARVLLIVVPAVMLARVAGFALNWIWYLSVVGVAIQMCLNLLLLRREFRLRLNFQTAAPVNV